MGVTSPPTQEAYIGLSTLQYSISKHTPTNVESPTVWPVYRLHVWHKSKGLPGSELPVFPFSEFD